MGDTINDTVICCLQDSRNCLALLRRGRCYIETNQHNLAIEDFSRGIGIQPFDAWFFVERGIAYKGLNQHKKAISEFNKAIDLARRECDAFDWPLHEAEDCIAAFENRGNCYEILKMHEERIDNEKEASAVGINIEDCDDI